jgi:hypothetical protein
MLDIKPKSRVSKRPVRMPKYDIVTLCGRIALLEADAKEGLLLVLERMVSALETEEGSIAVLTDIRGRGEMSIAALGNQLPIVPMLGAAGDIYTTLTTNHNGLLQ